MTVSLEMHVLCMSSMRGMVCVTLTARPVSLCLTACAPAASVSLTGSTVACLMEDTIPLPVRTHTHTHTHTHTRARIRGEHTDYILAQHTKHAAWPGCHA